MNCPSRRTVLGSTGVIGLGTTLGLAAPAHAAKSPGRGPVFDTAPARAALNRLLPGHADGGGEAGCAGGCEGHPGGRPCDHRAQVSSAPQGRSACACASDGACASDYSCASTCAGGVIRSRPRGEQPWIECAIRRLQVPHLRRSVQRRPFHRLHMRPQQLQHALRELGLGPVGAAGQQQDAASPEADHHTIELSRLVHALLRAAANPSRTGASGAQQQGPVARTDGRPLTAGATSCGIVSPSSTTPSCPPAASPPRP
jgi:hypothetical protein